MWRGFVPKTNGIDVVIMAPNLENGPLGLNIVDVNGLVRCPRNNFTSVTRKPDGPDLAWVSL